MKFRHPSRGGVLRGRDPGVALSRFAGSLTPGYGPCIPPGYPPAVLQRNRRQKDVGNAQGAPPLCKRPRQRLLTGLSSVLISGRRCHSCRPMTFTLPAVGRDGLGASPRLPERCP